MMMRWLLVVVFLDFVLARIRNLNIHYGLDDIMVEHPDAVHLVENFLASEGKTVLNNTSRVPHEDEKTPSVLSIKDEEPASHDMHSDGTASQIIAERAREGTLKKMKGGKGKKQDLYGDTHSPTISRLPTFSPSTTPSPSISVERKGGKKGGKTTEGAKDSKKSKDHKSLKGKMQSEAPSSTPIPTATKLPTEPPSISPSPSRTTGPTSSLGKKGGKKGNENDGKKNVKSSKKGRDVGGRNKAKGHSEAPSLTLGPSITPAPSEMTVLPVAMPSSSSKPPLTLSPTRSASPTLNDVSQAATTDIGDSRSGQVTRFIPALKLTYTVSQNEDPDQDDYEGLKDVTHSFFNSSLSTYFENLGEVDFLGAELEFYLVLSTYIIEYQFKTSWETASGSQVPSVAELDIVAKDMFRDDSMSAFVRVLNMLSSSNVFSSTTNVVLGGSSEQPIKEDDGSVASSESPLEGEKIGDNGSLKVILPLLAIATLCVSLVVIAYLRSRRRSIFNFSNDVVEDNVTEATPIKDSPHGDLVDELPARQLSISSDYKNQSELRRDLLDALKLSNEDIDEIPVPKSELTTYGEYGD